MQVHPLNKLFYSLSSDWKGCNSETSEVSLHRPHGTSNLSKRVCIKQDSHLGVAYSTGCSFSTKRQTSDSASVAGTL